MEVKVFFIKNCYRFCMDNREVEFENIIKVLNGSITLEGESEICEGKPLFVVDFTKNEDSSKGNNSLSYSLEIIQNKNKDIILDETNKIKLIPVEQDKYSMMKGENESIENILCDTLLLVLKDIIEPMLPTLKTVEEFFSELEEAKNKEGVAVLRMK